MGYLPSFKEPLHKILNYKGKMSTSQWRILADITLIK